MGLLDEQLIVLIRPMIVSSLFTIGCCFMIIFSLLLTEGYSVRSDIEL